MTFYSLYVDQDKCLSTAAADRSEALATFEKQLGQKLRSEDSDAAIASYLLDEWDEHPHWTDHTIRIYATPV
jgi:hypothetical protein